MGKSAKKSATKVAEAPAAAAPAADAPVVHKKGGGGGNKRQPEKSIEKKKPTPKKQKKAHPPQPEEEVITPTSDSDEEDEPIQDTDAKADVPSKNGTDEPPTTNDSDASADESASEDDELDQDTKENDKSGEESSGEDNSEEDNDEEDNEKPSKTTKKKADTPQVEQASGSKTLFLGNLSFSVEQSDVEKFFKEAGEIAEVRFAKDRDGAFKGFGHVEFVTVEAAQQALKLNGQELLGRKVKLDLARERGAPAPHTGDSNQKGGKTQVQTVFIRGFDTKDGEDKIRSALEEHFGSCGEISRVSIPKDTEGGVKGIAYMDFADSDGFKKALELGGTELGESTLTVEEANPRGFSRGGGGGGRGRGGGGRFGGRDGGGRRGGGRFGGRRGGGGGRGRGGGRR